MLNEAPVTVAWLSYVEELEVEPLQGELELDPHAIRLLKCDSEQGQRSFEHSH